MIRAGCLHAVLLGSALLSCPAEAASFDCAKASQPDERAVCAGPKLSGLDTLMDRAYARAKTGAEPDERSHVLSDARAFLSRRHGCGADAGCLTSAYVGAIEDFEHYAPGPEIPASVSALDMVAAPPPETDQLPQREGGCVTTRIGAIGGRLEGDTAFESGTSVRFRDGGAQVSYDKVPAIVGSRRGDPVLLCLTSIPKHCPPNDDRGRMYTATNLRTRGTWSLPDSQHGCGGA